MSYITEIRTPEQKSKKMLKEEMTIIRLEMAIKKEQYRDKQKTKPQFREIIIENKSTLKPIKSIHEANVGKDHILNKFLHKIRF